MAFQETHDLLLWTWDRFCSPDTTIYSAMVSRTFGQDAVAMLALPHVDCSGVHQQAFFLELFRQGP